MPVVILARAWRDDRSGNADIRSSRTQYNPGTDHFGYTYDGLERLRAALELLLARDCPGLNTADTLAHAKLLFTLLTTREFDRWGRKCVSTMDLVEVVRRMAAVYAEAPRTKPETVIRTAVAAYGADRRPASEDPAGKAAGVAAALGSSAA